MKKKSIFEKGKMLLKAGALATTLGVTAIGCDVLGNNESEEDRVLNNDDWKTNPDAIEPHTGVSCNDIKRENSLPYNESVKNLCAIESTIMSTYNDIGENSTDRYNYCYRKYTEIFNDDTVSIKSNALNRSAIKNCVEKFEKGELVRDGYGKKVNHRDDCIQQGNAFRSCSYRTNEEPTQWDICEQNFGL